MYNRTSPYQAISSPSKIDQWCKPKPAAKLVLTLVRRSPLMLKERVKQISFESLSYSPFIPLYLRGGIDPQLFNYSHRYNRNLNYILYKKWKN